MWGTGKTIPPGRPVPPAPLAAGKRMLMSYNVPAWGAGQAGGLVATKWRGMVRFVSQYPLLLNLL